MATIEDLERRLHVAAELQGVVRTMKTISAVGIRQHQMAAEAIRDYVATVELGLRALLDADNLPADAKPSDATTIGILVGSDAGLCGGFNGQIVDHALEALAGARDARLISLGERIEAELDRANRPPGASFALPHTLEAIGPALRPVIGLLEDWRTTRGHSRILVFHNRPDIGSVFRPCTTFLLPISGKELSRIAGMPWRSRRLPVAARPHDDLFVLLRRQLVFSKLHAALIESRTAEHGARLVAMRAAERNIEDKRAALEAAWRAARQDAVTGEILDLVGSFEALEGNENGETAETT